MIANPCLIPSLDRISPTLTITENDQQIAFTIQDAFHYLGYDIVDGAMLGFHLLQRAIAFLLTKEDELNRLEFRDIRVRDGLELVSGMVREGRFTLDVDYVHSTAQQGVASDFYFKFSARGENIGLAPAVSQVPKSFLTMGRASKRTDDEPHLEGSLLAVSVQDAARFL
ncbi:hypothetical protein ACE1BS_15205 [Aeromonas jandaei]